MTEAPTRIRLLSANLYQGNPTPQKAAAKIKQLRPDVVGTQEMQAGMARFDVAGYRKFQADDEWGRGVGVFLREELEYDGHGFHQLSDRIGRRPGYDAPRWSTHVDFRKGGERLTVIDVHFPVVPRKTKPSTNTKVGRAFIQCFTATLALAEAKEKAGRKVAIIGDLNDRPHDGIPLWEWHPTKVLPAQGYSYVRQGVDYLASTHGEFANTRSVLMKNTGSDHDWLASSWLV